MIEFRTVAASIRSSLPAFKNQVIAWIKSKPDIRKLFLQDTTSAYSMELLVSNPWTNNLFDEKVIKKLSTRDLHGKTLLQFLGWSSSKDKQLRANVNRIDPNAEGLLKNDKSVKPSSTTSSSSARKFIPTTSTSFAGSSRRSRSRTRSSSNRRFFRGKKTTYLKRTTQNQQKLTFL